MALDSAFDRPNGSSHRTFADRAFAEIHEAIVSGRLAPGERLPIEDLAEQLGMSPMPIREALRQLHNVGLVQNIPHRGAAVTELSIDDLRSVYEARLALEPLAIRHAAERRTAQDVMRIRDAYATLRSVGRRRDPAAAWVAHRAFHYAIYHAARSEWLIRLITPLWESSERYRVATAVRWTLDRRSREHEAMLEAIDARDGERAAAVLHDHLATTANEAAAEMGHDALFELIDPSSLPEPLTPATS